MLRWLGLACASRGSNFDLTSTCTAGAALLRGYASSADQNFAAHLCDYGELRPVPAVAVDRWRGARWPSLTSLSRARGRPPCPPSGASHASPGHLERSLLVLLAKFCGLVHIIRHRSPQTAEGVQGSPGRAHGRPPGTLPCRNALSIFCVRNLLEKLTKQTSEVALAGICADYTHIAALAKPSSHIAAPPYSCLPTATRRPNVAYLRRSTARPKKGQSPK